MTLPAVTNPTVTVPHLRVPFTLNLDGSAAVIEQDSAEDVTQCVRMLLATPKGTREYVPGYGVDDPTFTGPDVAAVEAAISEWEPRADAQVTVAAPPASTLNITVTVGGGQ